MFDGIAVTCAWNHFSEMHFMQLSLSLLHESEKHEFRNGFYSVLGINTTEVEV